MQAGDCVEAVLSNCVTDPLRYTPQDDPKKVDFTFCQSPLHT